MCVRACEIHNLLTEKLVCMYVYIGLRLSNLIALRHHC